MSLIYEPKGRAREYAALALNIYRGCDHGCVYCYAPAALHMDREQFSQPEERSGFLGKLEREANALKPTEPILLCFSTDPYCNLDVRMKLARETIKILHAAGHRVTVLTKGGPRAFRDLDLFTPNDAFATTLTWQSEKYSLDWEPGAALPDDRCFTIERFHEAGIPTWVSLEPVLDPMAAKIWILRTHKFVDLYKIGRWNYDARANEIDWRKFAEDVTALCKSLGKAYMLKRDLACFLEPLPHPKELSR